MFGDNPAEKRRRRREFGVFPCLCLIALLWLLRPHGELVEAERITWRLEIEVERLQQETSSDWCRDLPASVLHHRPAPGRAPRRWPAGAASTAAPPGARSGWPTTRATAAARSAGPAHRRCASCHPTPQTERLGHREGPFVRSSSRKNDEQRWTCRLTEARWQQVPLGGWHPPAGGPLERGALQRIAPGLVRARLNAVPRNARLRPPSARAERRAIGRMTLGMPVTAPTPTQPRAAGRQPLLARVGRMARVAAGSGSSPRARSAGATRPADCIDLPPGHRPSQREALGCFAPRPARHPDRARSGHRQRRRLGPGAALITATGRRIWVRCQGRPTASPPRRAHKPCLVAASGRHAPAPPVGRAGRPPSAPARALRVHARPAHSVDTHGHLLAVS